MKILILSQFFWPESRTAPQSLGDLAEWLVEAGHDVLVVTGVPNHPLGRFYDGYRLKPWQWEEARGYRILRLPLVPDHSRSVTRRLLNYGTFFLSAMTAGWWLTRNFKCDAVLAYFAPLTMGPIAAWFKRAKGAPLVYWVTDLWPENIRATGVKIPPFLDKQLEALEGWSYERADVICLDSPGFVESLTEKGVDCGKLRVIPEAADERVFFPVAREAEVGSEWAFDGRFNIMYGGNLGSVQGLEAVVEAAHLLADVEEVQFVLIGDGTETQRLMDLAAQRGVANVRFVPRQPMDQMRRFYAWADALLVHLADRDVFKWQLPSKLLAYMACAKPILVGGRGVVCETVENAGAGLTCPPEDPQALASAARRLYAATSAQRAAMGANARAAFLAKYTRSAQMDALASVLESAAAPRGLP